MLFSCSKDASTSSAPSKNSQNEILLKEANSLFEKYRFHKTYEPEAIANAGTIELKVNDLQELDTLLSRINKVRVSERQLDSLKRAFLGDFHTKYDTGFSSRTDNSHEGDAIARSSLVEINKNTVWLKADGMASGSLDPNLLFSSTEINFQYGGYPAPEYCSFHGALGYTNPDGTIRWVSSGLIPGSGDDVSNTGTNPIGYGHRTMALEQIWLYRVKITVQAYGASFPVGYTFRVTGYFNIGLDFSLFEGPAHIQ